jgi:hypothetical protein
MVYLTSSWAQAHDPKRSDQAQQRDGWLTRRLRFDDLKARTTRK